MNLILQTSFLLLFCGCSTKTYWNVRTIATGDLAFDSSKICYLSSQAHSPLCFEIIKHKDRINAFLSLNRFRFSSNPITVQLIIQKNTFKEQFFVHEGGMRIKLSETATQRVIQALQNGIEVGILVDGFEERLTPGRFADEFNL